MVGAARNDAQLAFFAPFALKSREFVMMSVLLKKVAFYLGRKAAASPVVREKVAKATQGVVEEAKQIAKEEDRAYAAGKAFRRVFDKLKR